MCGGNGGRIKIRPYNMILAYGSQWMHLKKVSTIFNHYLKHAYKFLLFHHLYLGYFHYPVFAGRFYRGKSHSCSHHRIIYAADVVVQTIDLISKII